MRLALITILILGRVIQTYSQDIELITKQTKNLNTSEKYFVLKSDENIKQGLYEKRRYDNSLAIRGYYSKNKKDSIWIFYASNGDTTSIGYYTDDKPNGTWTIFEKFCRVKYRFDYSKYDLVEYNWYETLNEFPILIDTAWTVSEIDSPPLFIGKENPIEKISDIIRYPIRAIENGISGQVLISFIVDKDGNAYDFKVMKKVAKDLDAEALRVMKIHDKNWFPAKKDGLAITIKYFIPINFRLK